VVLERVVCNYQHFGVLGIVGRSVVDMVEFVDMVRLDMLMLVNQTLKVVLVRQHMMESSLRRVV